jgi:sulfur-carrier protein
MQVTVDLCGRLADGVGTEIAWPLPAPASVAAIRGALADRFPSLAIAFASMRVHAALDEVLVDDAAMVNPGQRLALFPPVSGG